MTIGEVFPCRESAFQPRDLGMSQDFANETLEDCVGLLGAWVAGYQAVEAREVEDVGAYCERVGKWFWGHGECELWGRWRNG